MPKAKVNGISINYEINGRNNSQTLVLLNGLTMSVDGWMFQIDSFSEKYKLLRYDCRGQGNSDKPDTEYSQEMHAEDLKGLLEILEISKAHLVGISNGGMIAQHFSLRYPEKVGALVLVDTCSHIDTLLRLIVESWIEASRTGGSELRFDVSLPLIFSERFIKDNFEKIREMKEINVETNPPKAVINLSNACLGHDLREEIFDIKSPTLIIVGEEDILIPKKYSRTLREKISGSRLVVMKNCGHVPPIEKPGEFNSIVLNFLKDYNPLI